MKREQILAILYEMAMVIGSEIRLRPLLTKTLQRLMFHTAFPCAAVFLETAEATAPEYDAPTAEVLLEVAVGDFDLGRLSGTRIAVPAALLRGGLQLGEDGKVLSALPCRTDYYKAFLRLPIGDCGIILLLAPQLPDTGLPLTTVFQPILGNLARAILLCRSNEAYTERISQGKRLAEEALRSLSSRNRLILDSVGEGICGLDRDGAVTFVNPAGAKLLGYLPEEMVGHSLHDIVHHQDSQGAYLPPEECPIHRTIVDGSRQQISEDLFSHSDGSRFPVEYVATPLMEESKVVGAVIIFQNIADRKKREEEILRLNEELERRVLERTAELEESRQALLRLVNDLNQKKGELEEANARLQELDRLKSMFVASMSHELRTPLNSIIGFSCILHDEWLGPVNEEQKVNLAAILRSGKHLLSLINDVIDVSKIEAGKIEPQVDDFDLAEAVAEAADTVRQESSTKGIELRIDVPKLQVRTDRRRMLQCVLNLMSNAVKFTDAGGVAVEAALVAGSEETVEIAVTDTGIGISEEDRPRLFQPFVRFATPSAAPGTGLGLYLSRKLAVEILNGDIRLAETGATGCRFVLSFPRGCP